MTRAGLQYSPLAEYLIFHVLNPGPAARYLSRHKLPKFRSQDQKFASLGLEGINTTSQFINANASRIDAQPISDSIQNRFRNIKCQFELTDEMSATNCKGLVSRVCHFCSRKSGQKILEMLLDFSKNLNDTCVVCIIFDCYAECSAGVGNYVIYVFIFELVSACYVECGGPGRNKVLLCRRSHLAIGRSEGDNGGEQGNDAGNKGLPVSKVGQPASKSCNVQRYREAGSAQNGSCGQKSDNFYWSDAAVPHVLTLPALAQVVERAS